MAQADAIAVTAVVAAPFCEAVWRACDGEGWLAARGIVLDSTGLEVAPTNDVAPHGSPGANA